MKSAMKKYLLPMLAVGAFVIAGCIVSGTFIIDELIVFGTSDGFYSEKIDLSDNETWEDHADDIDKIEKVGLEVWITRTTSNDWTITAYVADTLQDLDESFFDTITKNQVFGPFTVTGSADPGTSVKVISYSDSFAHLDHVQELLALIEDGRFNFYSIWESDPPGGEFGTIDSIRVILTLTGG
jgi:hypothetical protein